MTKDARESRKKDAQRADEVESKFRKHKILLCIYYYVIFRSLGLLAIVGSIYKYIFPDGVERRRRPVGVVCAAR